MRTHRIALALWAISVVLISAPASSQSFPAGGEEDLMVFKFSDLVAANSRTKLPYLEFMRVESMNGYIYDLAAGAIDEQSPHGEDEIYYVVAGRSEFTAGDKTVPVEPGDILYVRKNITHVFHNISEDLKLLVVFAPPDTD